MSISHPHTHTRTHTLAHTHTHTHTYLIHRLLTTVVPEVGAQSGLCFEVLAADGTHSLLLGDVSCGMLHQAALKRTDERTQLAW